MVLSLFCLKGGHIFPYYLSPFLFLFQSMAALFLIKFMIEPWLLRAMVNDISREKLEAFIKKIKLSNREMEVAYLIFLGQNNREIGENLYISPRTVKFHSYNIYQKSSVECRYQFINLIRNI
jgi:DNA-binding NarL/FixJ family response regulator